MVPAERPCCYHVALHSGHLKRFFRLSFTRRQAWLISLSCLLSDSAVLWAEGYRNHADTGRLTSWSHVPVVSFGAWLHQPEREKRSASCKFMSEISGLLDSYNISQLTKLTYQQQNGCKYTRYQFRSKKIQYLPLYNTLVSLVNEHQLTWYITAHLGLADIYLMWLRG